MPPKANRRILGERGGLIVAGHESPHKFDQFSLDHLGTGEGAQAYSKGLYFWENPKVGASYNEDFASRLKDDDPRWNEYGRQQAAHEWWRRHSKENSYPGPYDTLFDIADFRGNIPRRGGQSIEAAAFDGLLSQEQRDRLAHLKSQVPSQSVELSRKVQSAAPIRQSTMGYYETLYDYLSPEIRGHLLHQPTPDNSDRYLRQREQALGDRVQWASAMADQYPIHNWDIGPEPPLPAEPDLPQPFTYHVNIGADRSELPDLNVMLNQQPPRLRDALLDFAEPLSPELSPQERDFLTLNDLRRSSWREQGAERPKEAHPNLGTFEAGLLARGIPGVRYDDYSGRRSPVGGTQNFVVYDPSIIELVKRYPYSLLAPMLLGAASQGREQEAERILGQSLLSQ